MGMYSASLRSELIVECVNCQISGMTFELWCPFCIYLSVSILYETGALSYINNLSKKIVESWSYPQICTKSLMLKVKHASLLERSIYSYNSCQNIVPHSSMVFASGVCSYYRSWLPSVLGFGANRDVLG